MPSEMSVVRFHVKGEPVPAARPRFARVGPGVRTYAPKSNTVYADTVRFAYTEAYGDFSFPRGVPLMLDLVFEIGRPKSHYGTGRNADRLKDSAPNRHIVKPDLDNLIKLVKDALSGFAWHDDQQVAEVTARKRYAQSGGHPGTEVMVAEVGGVFDLLA